MEETPRVPSAGAPRVVTSREQGGPWHYRSLILNFARRDLRARFKGSIFGLLWSLVVPLASLGIYALVFGTFFGGNTPPTMGNGRDNPFAVWLFTGLVVWNMFATTLATAIASLVGTGPLLKKIYFPAYASVYGSVLATFYQSLIEVGILIATLAIYRNIGWTWLLLVVWVAIFGVFVTAVSLLFAVANVYWRDVSHFIGIVLQLMFYLTPIIYPLTRVTQHVGGIPAASVIRILPIASYVEVFRSLIYDLDVGAARAWLTILGWAGIASLLAWALYRRKGLDLSEEL
jgi:ABC-type polysaccharide/polyol phosphate export permease